MSSWGVWEWIGALANVLQIITVIIVAVVSVLSYLDMRRFRRERKAARTERPWAMVIARDDISGQVQAYLQDIGLELKQDDPIVFGTLTSPDQVMDVLHTVNRHKQRLTAAGATEVHLFYSGPVTLAAGIGAILDNWVPVHTYDFVAGSYRAGVILDKETVKGLSRRDMISPPAEKLAS